MPLSIIVERESGGGKGAGEWDGCACGELDGFAAACASDTSAAGKVASLRDRNRDAGEMTVGRWCADAAAAAAAEVGEAAGGGSLTLVAAAAAVLIPICMPPREYGWNSDECVDGVWPSLPDGLERPECEGGEEIGVWVPVPVLVATVGR